MVPTSPYPNIAASYDLKIVGFRNPMSHFAPTVARCMSHLAHNSDCSFGDRRILFGNRKVTDSGRRSEEHTSELQSHVNLVCRLLLEKKLAQGYVPLATNDVQVVLVPTYRFVRGVVIFFFNDTAPPEIYPLSPPDALPT